MRTVYESDAFILQRDDLRQLAALRRRGVRLELDTLRAAFAALLPGLADIQRGEWSFLLDMREAPLRNDVDFERAMGLELAALIAGFRRRATLVKTAMGALQVNRASRSVWGDDRDTLPEVFRDEDEAMQHLFS